MRNLRRLEGLTSFISKRVLSQRDSIGPVGQLPSSVASVNTGIVWVAGGATGVVISNQPLNNENVRSICVTIASGTLPGQQSGPRRNRLGSRWRQRSPD